MRDMTKILLSAATVCAVGAVVHPRAEANPVPGQNPPVQNPPGQVPSPPIPSDNPSPTLPPGDPATSSPTRPGDTAPGSPAVPSNHPTPGVPVDQPPPTTPDPTAPATPLPDQPPTTTTTTTDGDTSGMEPDIYSYSWNEPLLSSGIGVSTILGGGIAGFTDKAMRSTTSDLGGLWDLRIAIGSHLPIALELGYVGTATNINGLPTGNKGRLIGTTVEGALRWNVLPHYPWTPYVFAGMGWQRYDVTNTTVSLADSGMADHDNLMVFPMGVGMAYRIAGFVADVRGTFRVATDNNLLLTTPTTQPTSSDFAAMHTWEASTAVGYEF